MKRMLLVVTTLALISLLALVSFALPEAIDVKLGVTPTVDGVISPKEWDDADKIEFPTDGGNCTVYFKHNGSVLYVAFNVPNKDSDSGVQIFVDTNYDQASAPQTDDYRFTIARKSPPNDYGENQGTGTDWTAWGSPVGWKGKYQDLTSTWLSLLYLLAS